MSRFGKRLILWLIVSSLILGTLSLVFLTIGVDKYYLSVKKIGLQKSFEEISTLPIQTIYRNAHQLGKEHQVLLLVIPWQESLTEINEEIKNGFVSQGVLLNKLWLSEEHAKELRDGEVVNQLYNQGSSGYSLLIKYGIQEDNLLVISYVIPHIKDILRIINLFIIGVWITAIGAIILCMMLYIRRITRPLLAMECLINQIGELKFGQLQIKTGDELESLANGINRMSEQLAMSHQQLKEKNEQMKDFLSNVSHELKTPIALIKAYGIALQEGMDDGTYLLTILQQNERMEEMVAKLLLIAKAEHQAIDYTIVDMKQILEECVDSYKLYRQEVTTQIHIEPVRCIYTDKEIIHCAVRNLISNAFKYTVDKKISIDCYEKEDAVHIEIRNGISEQGKAAIPNIWEPFFVVEESRNKALCGTGLGLYMTRKFLDKLAIAHGCFLEGDRVVFYIIAKTYRP